MTDFEMPTAVAAADAIRRGEMKAAELLEYSIEAIERENDTLNAFVHLDYEGARAAAAAVDDRVGRGDDPGPFAGIPMGVKDLEDCAGMPTSHGSLLYKGQPAAVEDSILFARVDIGRHAKIRRAIIDKGVQIPEGIRIGYDEEEDRDHSFTVTASGVVVIAESHVALHTWPEHRFAAVDIFSCTRALDQSLIIARLGDWLRTTGQQVHAHERGLVSLPASDSRIIK